MLACSAFPKIAPQPLQRRASQIAEILRAMISQGQLKAGDRLPTEEMLCEHFQVSRTTVRESVQMLRASGLLEVTPGRGSYVRLPKPEQVMAEMGLMARLLPHSPAELQQVRLEMERLCLARLAKLPANRRQMPTVAMATGLSVATNVAAEEAWHQGLAQQAQSPLTGWLLQLLQAFSRGQLEAALADPADVTRRQQTLLRINAALAGDDVTQADRLLTQYLSHGGQLAN